MRRCLSVICLLFLAACLPQPQADGTNSVDWDGALTLLYSGRIATVTRGLESAVTLVTRDGRIVTTHEPRDGALTEALSTCGRACEGIAVLAS
jgi:hypothetical protein